MSRFGAVHHIANPNRHGVDTGTSDAAFSPDGRTVVTVGTGAFFEVGTWLQTSNFNDSGASTVRWLPDGRVITLGASLARIDLTGARTPLGKVKFTFAPRVTLVRDGVLYGADGVWDGGRPDKPMLRGISLDDGAKVCARTPPSVLASLLDAGPSGLFAHWHVQGGAQSLGFFDPAKGDLLRAVAFPDEIRCATSCGGRLWIATEDALFEVGADLTCTRRAALDDLWAEARPWGDRLVVLTETMDLLLVDPSVGRVEDRVSVPGPSDGSLVVGSTHALITGRRLQAVPLLP